MEKNQMPFGIKYIEDNSGFLLWQITSLWQQEQKKILQNEYNISHSQYVILASTYWLTLNDEEVTQIKLSHHTKMEPMTVSQILKGLQKIGYISRRAHSEDTRAKSVFLTAEGKELMKDAIKSIESIDAKFFSALGKGIGKFNTDMIKLIKNNS